PPGASVWINGDLRREVTPTTITQLPLGVPLDVKLTKDGFEHARREIVVDGTAPHEMTLTLKKGSVALEVRVSPDDAAAVIALDGKPLEAGRAEGLTSGVSHRLTVEAPGYLPQTVTFTGSPLETKEVEIVLAKAPEAEPRARHRVVATAGAQAGGGSAVPVA